MCDARVVQAMTTIDTDCLPIGRHTGYWSGYRVEFTVDGRDYVLETNVGTQVPKFECFIDVRVGEEVQVWTKKNEKE